MAPKGLISLALHESTACGAAPCDAAVSAAKSSETHRFQISRPLPGRGMAGVEGLGRRLRP